MLTLVLPSLTQVAAPPAPQAPPPPRVVFVQPEQVVAVQAPSAPLNGQQVRALLDRRSELSRQLTSAQGRRNDLSEEIRKTPDASREGLQQRAAQLDQRIMQIEGDLAEVGRQLANSGRVTASTSPQSSLPFGMSPGQVTGVSIVFTVLVLFPMALAMARSIWRRGSILPRHLTPSPESGERLERLEQAVDAIAIEIERVSEGQRFVTQILTRGEALHVGGGQPAADPLRARLPDRARLSSELG